MKAGYSILEVLVAFVIMTMVLITLVPGQARLLGRAKVAQERVLAYDYAVSVMEEAALLGRSSAMSQAHEHRSWQVSTRLEPLAPVDDAPAQTRISVEIRASNGALLAQTQSLAGPGRSNDAP